MRKLTVEERDLLDSVLHHDGLKPLLAVLEGECEALESDVLKLSMDNSSAQELVNRKLRAEGARRLFLAFNKKLSALKSKQ